MLYEIHEVVQQAYLEVHEWLNNGTPRSKTWGYMSMHKPCPDKVDMLHVAAQFASYFPTHHFKNRYALSKIMDAGTFVDQLQHNPIVVAVDIGCGGGAASAALVSAILDLQAEQRLQRNLNLICIGVDPAENVLAIYNQLMTNIKQRLPSSSITMLIRVVDRSVSESVTDLDEHMREVLQKWRQPALTHVFLMQSNIVSPLDRLYEDQQCRHERFRIREIPAGAYLGDPEFGMRESRSYRQLFGQLPIDNMHAITVGTNDNKLSKRAERDWVTLYAESCSDGHKLESFG